MALPPPLVTVSGAFNLGPSPQGPTKDHDVTFQYQDTFSWTRGKHALKFGADIRWAQSNFHYDFYNNGSFDYGSYYTNTGSALDIGKWLHNAGAFGMWLPVAIIIVMGFVGWHRFGAATRFSAASLIPRAHLKDIVFWATLTYALGGCETASFMSEEVKNPRRTIPQALLLGGLIVTFCYILGTVSVLLALPQNEVSGLQGLMQAVTRTASRLGWFAVIPIAAALIALSNLGAAGAYLAAVARLPFVAGMDRLLPSVFGKLHRRWGTPYVALLLQLLCGVLFVFLGQAGTSVRGAYDVLVSMGIITYFVPYAFLFAAMFRLQREKAGPDVICVPGGGRVAKLVACVGLITTLLTLALAVVPPAEEPHKVLATVKIVGLSAILIGVGAVLYYAATRKNQSSQL